MYLSEGLHEYRFDNFLEEARNLINKYKASMYFHLILARKYVWEDLENLMKDYSEDGRRAWTVNLLRTRQDDFYILQFVNKSDETEAHRFFWKVIPESDNIVILSFTMEKFKFVKSCIRSFVHSADMEFPWLGSVFLENLDSFLNSVFGADARLAYRKIIYDSAPVARKGKTETNLKFTATSREDIWKRKLNDYERFHKFLYIRRVRTSVHWKGMPFLFSISDDAEILFEKGDLLTFMNIINSLRNIVDHYRRLARKRFDIKVKEITIENGIKTELMSIQNLEVLKLQIKEPMTSEWYKNLTELFSAPYNPQEKLMSFVLMQGNPYFLAQIIDLEKGGSGIYLSATGNAIRISPSSKETSITTVLKIIEVLQKYVDPNITIAGA